MTAVYVEVE